MPRIGQKFILGEIAPGTANVTANIIADVAALATSASGAAKAPIFAPAQTARNLARDSIGQAGIGDGRRRSYSKRRNRQTAEYSWDSEVRCPRPTCCVPNLHSLAKMLREPQLEFALRNHYCTIGFSPEHHVDSV